MATKIFEVYGTVRADTRALAADLAKAKGLMLRFGTGSGAAIKDNLGTIGRTLAAFPARIFQNIFNPSAAGMAAAMTDRIAGTGQALGGLAQVARGAGGLLRQMFMGASGGGGAGMFTKALTNIRSVAGRVFGPIGRTIGTAFAPFAGSLGTMAAGFTQFAAGLVRGTTGWASMWVSTISGGVRSFANAFSQIGSMARAVVGPIAAIGSALAIGGAVRSFAAFDAEMRNVQVISHATDAEFQSMTEHARELGRTTVFGATSAAQALTELVKGGFSAADSQLVLGDTLNLAAAANMSLANASTLMVRILSSQGLAMSESARVADVLTNAANLSTTDVAALGEAFRQVGPLTKQAGMSIEETSAIFMAFAAAGIDASSAGNNLKRILTRMVQQPRAVAREFQALGITIDNGQGGFRSMADIIDDLNRATANMTDIEKQAAIGKIGGLYAASALMQAMDVGGDAIRRNTQLVSQSGTAAAVAGVRTQGLMGAFRLLAAVAQDLGISLGKALGPMLESITGWLKNVAAEMGPWIEMNGEMIAKVAGITLAIGGLVVVLPMLGRTILGMFGPVGILLGVFTALGVAIYRASSQPGFLQAAFKTLGAAAASVGNILTSIWTRVAPIFKPIGDAMLGMLAGIAKWVTANQTTLIRYGTAIATIFLNVIRILGSLIVTVGNVIGKFANLFGITGDNWLEKFTLLAEAIAVMTGDIESSFSVMWDHVKSAAYSALAAILLRIEQFADNVSNTLTLGITGGIQADFGSDAARDEARIRQRRANATFAAMQANAAAANAPVAAPVAISPDAISMSERAEALRQQAMQRGPALRAQAAQIMAAHGAEEATTYATSSAFIMRQALRNLSASQRQHPEIMDIERRAQAIESASPGHQARRLISQADEMDTQAALAEAAAARRTEAEAFAANLRAQNDRQVAVDTNPAALAFAASLRSRLDRQVREDRLPDRMTGILGGLAGGFGGLGSLGAMGGAIVGLGPDMAAPSATARTDAGVKVSGVSDLWRQVQEGMGKATPADPVVAALDPIATNTANTAAHLATLVNHPQPAITSD